MKGLLAKILSISVIAANLSVCVYAADGYYTDFSEDAPANWKLNQASTASISDGYLQIQQGESDKWAVWTATQPYPTGRVMVEYDFMSESDKASIYIQNPNGGSTCRLQQVAGNVLQLQHSKDDISSNANTVVLNRTFETGTWYHIKHVIDYRDNTNDTANRTTSSVYVYDTSNELLGSAEDKVYMDASRYTSPTYLRVFQINNMGSEGSGSVYLDNFKVYEYVSENDPEGNVYAFNFDDNTLPAGMTGKNTNGFNGVRNQRIELTAAEDPASDTYKPEIVANLNKMAYKTLSGKVVAEFDYVSTSDKGIISYFQAAPNGGSLVRIEQTSATAAKVVTGGAEETVANTNINIPFEQGGDYHAKVELDYDNELCSIYINGEAFAENHHFMNSTSPGYLRDILMQNNGTIGTIAVDNLVIYNNDDSGAVLATEAMLDIAGKDAVADDLSLTTTGYNGAAITWTSSAPEIIADTGELVSAPADDTSVTLTAHISKGIKSAEKTITVTVKKADGYQDVSFSEPVVEGEGGTKTATISVTKPIGKELTFSFVVAVYNSDGAVSGVNYDSCTIDANSSEGSLTIDIPDVQDIENKTLKYFVWDSMQTMVPLK